MSQSGLPKIAVLASGRGSNFEAILRAIAEKKLEAQVVGLLSDRKDAGALKVAENAGLLGVVVPGIGAESGLSLEERRKTHDQRVLRALETLQPDFLVMAGYMRVVTPVLLEAYRSKRGYTRIANVHPSLLPAFPGIHSYAQAFRHGVKWTGVTVHLVEEEVDSGPICAQEAFSIAGLKSPEEVEQRGLKIEHRLYPETLNWVLREEFEVELRERRLCVCPN